MPIYPVYKYNIFSTCCTDIPAYCPVIPSFPDASLSDAFFSSFPSASLAVGIYSVIKLESYDNKKKMK